MEDYLEMTGQTLEYVMSGGIQYGPTFIYKLVAQALKEKKRIVWKTRLIDGEDVGLCDFELRPIKKRKNDKIKSISDDLKESIRKALNEVSNEEIDELDPARRMKALIQGAKPKNEDEKKLLAEMKKMIAEGKIIDIPEM